MRRSLPWCVATLTKRERGEVVEQLRDPRVTGTDRLFVDGEAALVEPGALLLVGLLLSCADTVSAESLDEVRALNNEVIRLRRGQCGDQP